MFAIDELIQEEGWWIFKQSHVVYQYKNAFCKFVDLSGAIAGPVEELAKFAALLVVPQVRRAIVDRRSGLYYAGLCALGFAMIENVAYFQSAERVLLVRAAPVHVVFSAIWGASYGAWVSKDASLFGLTRAIAFGIGLHALWNALAKSHVTLFVIMWVSTLWLGLDFIRNVLRADTCRSIKPGASTTFVKRSLVWLRKMLKEARDLRTSRLFRRLWIMLTIGGAGLLVFIQFVPALAVVSTWVGFIAVLVFLHLAWRLVRQHPNAIPPWKAIGLLFVPIYQSYWIFRVVRGLAKQLNCYCEQEGLQVAKVSVGTVSVYCAIQSYWMLDTLICKILPLALYDAVYIYEGPYRPIGVGLGIANVILGIAAFRSLARCADGVRAHRLASPGTSHVPDTPVEKESGADLTSNETAEDTQVAMMFSHIMEFVIPVYILRLLAVLGSPESAGAFELTLLTFIGTGICLCLTFLAIKLKAPLRVLRRATLAVGIGILVFIVARFVTRPLDEKRREAAERARQAAELEQIRRRIEGQQEQDHD